MKDFSPIVRYSVGRWFTHWCVKAERAKGVVPEAVHVCDRQDVAKAKLAALAARKGFILAEDGMSATRPKDD